MRMATDLHGGLVQRQPPPRRFHIYRFRLGFSPHTPAPEPTTELFSPAPVRRSHPFIFTSRCQPINKFLRPAAFVQRTGKTTFAGLRSVRLRGKRSRLWCRRLGSNQRPEPDICLAPLYPTELRLHEGGARLSEPPDLFRASLLPADHRRNYNIEA